MTAALDAVGRAAQCFCSGVLAAVREPLLAVREAVAAALQLNPAPAPRTKTVRIRWTEESQHELTVRVVADFDPDNRDLSPTAWRRCRTPVTCS